MDSGNQQQPQGQQDRGGLTANWHLTTVWGIPIGIHWSMSFVFALLTISLAVAYFPETDPNLRPPTYWVMALVTASLFYGSILLHELGHAWVALRNKLPVEDITLFIFGGVARLGGRATNAGAELRIAAGGPAVSLALTLVFGAISYVTQDFTYISAPTGWLARLNLILLVFNLVPGFPLDGGRILRALVWQFTGNERRATRVSLISGQVLAFGLMGLGAFIAFSGNFANGIWFILIGWFLQNAAVSEATGSRVEQALRGATVRQAMGPREPQVSSRLKVRQFVDEHVLRTGHGYFLVVEDDVPRGVVTLRDLVHVPQERWDWADVSEIMTPWSRLNVVSPDTDLITAMQLMDEASVSSLPVMDGQQVCGLLTREEVMRYVRLRIALDQGNNR